MTSFGYVRKNVTGADQSADQQRAIIVEAAGAMQIEPARRLQEPTASDRPVLDEMIANLEPGDEVVVFNREVVGDDAAAAIEEKGATLHSVTEPHQPTRTFGYVRTANGSADSQRAAITEAVGAIRIFSDEGVSGTTAGTDRPGLRELVADLQAGDEVVVWQYDRLGRTLEAMRAVVELIIAKGATLRSVTESPAITSAEGLFSMKFMMAVAEYERAWKLEK